MRSRTEPWHKPSGATCTGRTPFVQDGAVVCYQTVGWCACTRIWALNGCGVFVCQVAWACSAVCCVSHACLSQRYAACRMPCSASARGIEPGGLDLEDARARHATHFVCGAFRTCVSVNRVSEAKPYTTLRQESISQPVGSGEIHYKGFGNFTRPQKRFPRRAFAFCFWGTTLEKNILEGYEQILHF